MADNEIRGEILAGGLIKLTTDNISDPDLHLAMEVFVAGVEKDSGGTYKVLPHKEGAAHTHTHSDGTTHTHQH
jgi:hypothetical protein